MPDEWNLVGSLISVTSAERQVFPSSSNNGEVAPPRPAAENLTGAHTTRCLIGGPFEVAGRPWGFWTRAKLGILSAYLDAFTTASKSRPERLYLDLFAGEPENQERVTLDEIRGSARVALDTANHEFTRLRFFERPAQAGKLEAALRADYPGRDIQVIPGDCNR